MSQTPQYASVADLRGRQGARTDRNDAAYAAALLAAESMVDHYCGRSFTRGPVETRLFRARTSKLCRIADIIDIALVELGGTLRVSGTFTEVTPLNDYIIAHARTGMPIHLIEHATSGFVQGNWIRVTPLTGWGWTSVPAAVHEATLLHAAKLVKRADSPEGVAGFADAGIVNVDRKGLDGDAAALLRPFRRIERIAP